MACRLVRAVFDIPTQRCAFPHSSHVFYFKPLLQSQRNLTNLLFLVLGYVAFVTFSSPGAWYTAGHANTSPTVRFSPHHSRTNLTFSVGRKRRMMECNSPPERNSRTLLVELPPVASEVSAAFLVFVVTHSSRSIVFCMSICFP